jgi:hypothetical protein
MRDRKAAGPRKTYSSCFKSRRNEYQLFLFITGNDNLAVQGDEAVDFTPYSHLAIYVDTGSMEKQIPGAVHEVVTISRADDHRPACIIYLPTKTGLAHVATPRYVVEVATHSSIQLLVVRLQDNVAAINSAT